MKKEFLPILIVLQVAATGPMMARHDIYLVNIGDLKTVGGEVITDCNIGYRTVGKLNSDSSNIILWPSWFDGTSESIVKPYNLPRWIDSTGFYIIVVDALGNGVSSSPSNTEDFPVITIRDMVNSQHELLVNHLNIAHVYAIIGISMGGMQAFEWMVSYPDFMDKVIPIVGTPKQSSFDIYVWQTQADLIVATGSEEDEIDQVMSRVYDICIMNCYTPSYFVRNIKPEEINNWRNYRHFMNSMDYLAQLEAMIDHDIYKRNSCDLESISDVVMADALIIVSLQDHLVNPSGSIQFAKKMGCNLVELTGDCGHSAIWCEAEKIKEATKSFLQQ